MHRDIFTNKWILGGLGFLVIFAGLCYLWYQHTTAPYREHGADFDKRIHQYEKRKNTANSKQNELVEDTSVENSINTTDKQITDTNHVTQKTEQTQIQKKTHTHTTPTAEIRDAQVSPHGFGPYPDVPDDYFRKPSWLRYSNINRLPDDGADAFEIMDRVLIKLWNQGHKNITGSIYRNGLVYPHYKNTAYVVYEKIELPDGTTHWWITGVFGGPDIGPFAKQIKSGKTPAHIKLLDYDTAGIDPHTFLNGEN